MSEILNTDRVIIGVDNFHYAKLFKDNASLLQHGTVKKMPMTIELNVTTNSSTETLFADNQPAIVYSTIGVVEVTMNRTNLPNEFLADVLGSPVEGGTRHVTNAQTSEYVGIAWRQLYSDGTYAYVKLYKGKFSEPDHNARTKEDGVEFQTREIMGNFVATIHEKTIGTAPNEIKFKLLMAVADEMDDGYANEGDTWFNYVYTQPTAWAATTVYALDAVVSYQGAVYACTSAHTSTSTFDPTKWQLI